MPPPGQETFHNPPQGCIGRGGGTPPPPPLARCPAYAQPSSVKRQVPASMAFVTDGNRPQPLWQPRGGDYNRSGCNTPPLPAICQNFGGGGLGGQLGGGAAGRSWGGWAGVCGGGGGGHKASVSDCLPLAAPIGLSPLLSLTLCGPERGLVLSTEPPDDLSCLTTPGVGCPGDGLLPVPLTRGIQMHTPSPCGGLPTPALT